MYFQCNYKKSQSKLIKMHTSVLAFLLHLTIKTETKQTTTTKNVIKT